jgi:AcrR family transcriptional regulator
VEKRTYRSRLRDERAADTRDRIVTAARELFAARGFGGATMAAIADQAGVAQQTLYATFGSKRDIAAALLARMEDEAEAPVWLERITNESDPRSKLALFAAWSNALFTTSRDVVVAVHRGPAITDLMEEGERQRRQAIDALVTSLHASAALRSDITVQQAIDRAWILTGPEIYLLATSCGWEPREYQDWLSALLADQILRPPAPAAPSSGRSAKARR